MPKIGLKSEKKDPNSSNLSIVNIAEIHIPSVTCFEELIRSPMNFCT